MWLKYKHKFGYGNEKKWSWRNIFDNDGELELHLEELREEHNWSEHYRGIEYYVEEHPPLEILEEEIKETERRVLSNQEYLKKLKEEKEKVESKVLEEMRKELLPSVDDIAYTAVAYGCADISFPEYKVVLSSVVDKVGTMKRLREVLATTLPDTKQIVNTTPAILKEKMYDWDAEELIKKFEDVDCTLEMQEHSD